MEGDLQIVIKTLAGLEPVLAREVRQLGGREVKTTKRAVICEGDIGFVYKANLWLRTAIRVLVQLDRFQIRDEEHLYRKVKGIAWEDLFEVNRTIAVDATVFSDQFRNSLFIAQKTKDAIVDRFRDKTGKRPSVQLRTPDIAINVHIQQRWLTISLDASGDSLHLRKYRQAVDAAPLNEVLAAGILALSNWDPQLPLIDPMCGSGTFLLEAALRASNVPANVFRKDFAFMQWKNFDEELYQLIFDKSLEKENQSLPPLLGFDKDAKVLLKSRRNARSALMEDHIKFKPADFLNWPEELEIPPRGIIVMNPPYDIKIEADIPVLYKGIGDTLKQHFSGYTAWIFTASEEGLKNLGLKPSQKIKLKNGKLDSWLVRYDLYEGSRKKQG